MVFVRLAGTGSPQLVPRCGFCAGCGVTDGPHSGITSPPQSDNARLRAEVTRCGTEPARTKLMCQHFRNVFELAQGACTGSALLGYVLLACVHPVSDTSELKSD